MARPKVFESKEEYKKVWYEENKEKLAEKSAKNYQKYKDKYRELRKDYRQKNTATMLKLGAKRRAKNNGLDFELEKEDITIPDVCPIFKVPFEKHIRFAASLDRVDSTKGYTKDNIQVISRLGNAMKNNASKEELLMFAEWIFKEYGDKNV